MKKTASILLIVFCTAILIGCNTMQGVGKDIKTLGEKIEGASDRD